MRSPCLSPAGSRQARRRRRRHQAPSGVQEPHAGSRRACFAHAERVSPAFVVCLAFAGVKDRLDRLPWPSCPGGQARTVMVERAPGRPSGLPRNREPAGAQGSGQRLRVAMLREFAGGPGKAAEALRQRAEVAKLRCPAFRISVPASVRQPRPAENQGFCASCPEVAGMRSGRKSTGWIRTSPAPARQSS